MHLELICLFCFIFNAKKVRVKIRWAPRWLPYLQLSWWFMIFKFFLLFSLAQCDGQKSYLFLWCLVKLVPVVFCSLLQRWTRWVWAFWFWGAFLPSRSLSQSNLSRWFQRGPFYLFVFWQHNCTFGLLFMSWYQLSYCFLRFWQTTLADDQFKPAKVTIFISWKQSVEFWRTLTKEKAVDPICPCPFAPGRMPPVTIAPCPSQDAPSDRCP